MEIIGCGIDEPPSGLQFCTSLQYLKIEDCPNLKSILDSLHTSVSLQKFVVRYCPQLSSLPGVPSIIQQFSKSLQYLEIQYCQNLKSIPDLGEVFHSLINLKISNCPDPRLKLLREGRLKTLVIGGFIEELDAFPILRYPSIRYSHASLKNLMYLPILHLSNLKYLYIYDCRNLEKRYAKGSGAEWFQIAHVPNININGKCIQGKDSDNFDYEEFDVFDDVSEDD